MSRQRACGAGFLAERGLEVERTRIKESDGNRASESTEPQCLYTASGLATLRADARRRLSQVVNSVKNWWAGITSRFAPREVLPEQPDHLKEPLARYDQQLQSSEHAVTASLFRAKLNFTTVQDEFSQATADLNTSTQAERAAQALSKAEQLANAEEERALSAQIEHLEAELRSEEAQRLALENHLALRQTLNKLANPQEDRTAKRLRKLDAKMRRENNPVIKAQIAKNIAAILTAKTAFRTALERCLSEKIPWNEELIFAGVRPPPPGLFDQPIASTLGPALIVGAGGALAEVDWKNPELAIVEATKILAAQTQPIQRGGHRRHVGHLVISMPNDDGEFPFTLSPDSAVRLARQALLSQGADPDLHDFVVFVHRQRKADGDNHDEEALHLLWSRVRVDGKYLINDNRLISALLGRARWDLAAGFDERGLGMPRLNSACVRRGLRGLSKQSLTAVYRGFTREYDETIDFLSSDFLGRLGQEGCPPALACGGLWIPKPCYRTAEEISEILHHLYRAG